MVEKTLVVDRIDGPYAVLTDGTTTVDLPLGWLPPGVAEGWQLRLRFERDEGAEARLRAEIDARRRRLAADDDGGDFSL